MMEPQEKYYCYEEKERKDREYSENEYKGYRETKRKNCYEIVVFIITIILALVVGILIGAMMSATILGALAAIIVLIVLLVLLLIIYIILSICYNKKRNKYC